MPFIQLLDEESIKLFLRPRIFKQNKVQIRKTLDAVEEQKTKKTT